MRDTEPMPPRRCSDNGLSLSNRRVVIAIAVALLVAWLVSRLLIAWRFPLFLDDGIVASYGQITAFDRGARFIALLDNRGLMGGWMNAVLIYLGLTPIAAIRVYHLTSSLLTAIMTSLIAYRIWGTRVALTVAGIIVVLPYLFVYSVVGIYDTFVAACAMSALFIEMKLVEKPRFDLAMVLGFIIGAAVLTKQSGAFLLILLPFSLILFPWRQHDRDRQLLMWFAGAAIAVVITGLFYSLQFLTPIFYNTPQIPNHHPLGDAVAHAFTYFRRNWPGFQAALIGYLTPTLIVLLAVGIWHGFLSRPRHTTLLLIWVLIPVGSASIVATIWAPRYLLFAVPPLAAFIGLGLATAFAFVARQRALRIRLALAAGIAVLFVPALHLDGEVVANPETAAYPGADEWHYVTSEQLSGGPLSDVVGEIKQRTKAGHVPVVATFNSFNPGVLFVALNGRAYGPNTKYIVTGTQANVPGNAEFLVIEDRTIVPYYKYGWPLDSLLDRPGARGIIDQHYRDVRPALTRFRLIRRIDRPRGGASVFLYEKRPASAN